MSDAGGTQLSVVRGSVAAGNTFGTAIASPAFKRIRIASDALDFNVGTVESPELTTGFRVKSLRPVTADAGGTVAAPFIFGNLDEILEVLFFSTWVKTPQRYNSSSDENITDVAAATGVYTITTATATDNRYGTPAAGHLIRTTGFTNAGNNALKKATAASSTSFTVSTSGLVNEAAPPAGARAKVVGFEGASGDITTTAGGTNSIGSTALDFTTLGLAKGMWLRVGGSATGNKFATAANNGWVRISRSTAVTATTITLDRVPTGWTTDAGTGKTIQIWMPDYLRDGVEAKEWFDIEVDFTQLDTEEFHYYLSMIPTTFTLPIQANQIKVPSVAFIGADRTIDTTRVSGATDKTADALSAIPRTGTVYDASNNVADIAENATSLLDAVTGLTWTIANSVAGTRVVGRKGFGRTTRGRFRPSVALNSYYDSSSLIDKLAAGTVTSFHSILPDPSGTAAYIFDLPQANLQSAPVSGIEADGQIQANYTMLGIEDTSLDCAMQIMRFEEMV